MNKKIKMILFDLDGTLWDSGENVAESWNVVIRKWRSARPELPLRLLNADDIHGVMGKPMSEIAGIFFGDLSEEDRRSIAHECETYEVDYIAEHGGVLFPEIKETLQYLLDKGYKLAIVSNCQSGYIGAFLKSMDTAGYFCDFEEWGNTGRPKGENIKLVMERNGISDGPGAAESEAIYVGDTTGDMTAAHSAGLPFIHAAYGFGTADDAEYVISSFSELRTLF